VLDADRLAAAGSPLVSLPAVEDMRVVRVVLSRRPDLGGGGAGSRKRDVWLAKPLSLGRLRQVVLEVLAKSPSMSEATPVADVTYQPISRARPARVLVVEDNAVNQLVAEGMLIKLGYEVSLVSDGRSALVRLSTEDFDAVLMDCQMPGMDGYEATRGLRTAAQGKPRIPVIGLTAHAAAEVRDKCLQAGMDDFMSKPYTLDELGAMLTRWKVQRLERT
jgi:CheY-like chemotaxis protein